MGIPKTFRMTELEEASYLGFSRADGIEKVRTVGLLTDVAGAGVQCSVSSPLWVC